jgi:co-chaperonin GroES (HSP10)
MRTINSVVVKIKDTHDDKVLINGEKGKIELHIPLGNTVGDIDKSAAINTNTRIKLYGEVVGDVTLVRSGLSPIYQKEAGYPSPLSYRSSDAVAKTIYSFSEQKRKMYADHRATKYIPTDYVPEFVFADDQEIDIVPKDKVYFNYLGYSDDNFIKEEDGFKLYKIPIESIYCVVRDGELIMLNSHVLVKPYYGEGLTEVDVDGKNVWAKFLGKTDIIESIKEQPKAFEGILCHIGSPLGHNSRETLSKGDRIVFTPSYAFTAEQYKDKIEGEEYFVVQQWDIIGKVVDNIMSPVGDYVAMTQEGGLINDNRKIYNPKEEDQEFTKGQIFLLNDSVKKAKRDAGTVLGRGELCKNVAIGDKVRFHGGTYLEEYKCIMIRESNIWGIEK